MKFILVIEEGETSFGASYPDVAGCVAVGDSFEEAVSLGREALQFHLEEEDRFPKSRSLQEIADAGEVNLSDARLSFVSVELKAEGVAA